MSFVFLSEGSVGPQLELTKTRLVSHGWAATAVCGDGADRLAVRVLRAPNKYGNELHVSLRGVKWRTGQVAGMTDDGRVYSRYCVPASASSQRLVPWRREGDVASVVLDVAAHKGAFAVNGNIVHTFDLPAEERQFTLGARVHAYGGLEIVPS